MGLISFTVYGRPQPAGSKRAFKLPSGQTVVTDANKNAKPWKQEVASAAAGLTDELLQGPLDLEVVFYLQRPRGHFGQGRNAGIIKPSAPEFPTTKPDATKMLRAIEDALTGVLWRDDAQIVRQVVEKRYGAPERAEIAIRSADRDRSPSCSV
jgi:Holliday junction resolvase RusA-like endonuclease